MTALAGTLELCLQAFDFSLVKGGRQEDRLTPRIVKTAESSFIPALDSPNLDGRLIQLFSLAAFNPIFCVSPWPCRDIKMETTSNALTQGALLWSGEHWMVYLRPEGSEQDTGMLSLYHAYTSLAGMGTAAFVQIEGEDGFKGLCTDNTAFAQFVKDTLVGAYTPYDVDMPIVDADFSKGGDILERPTWTIGAQGREIVTTWLALKEPLAGPPTLHPKIVFTILVFAGSGSITLDGEPVPGDPYMRDGWKKSLGESKSSCCFALAETMVK
jgi:hypothetical protein